ncbi:MAG: protocatechuate 3,4-dioxygenase [Pyrinomonadaceae bacterium]
MNQDGKALTRRQMLELAFGLGGLAALSGPAFAQEAKRLLTPRVTRGPFYPLMKPLDTDADLTLLAGNKNRAEGRIVHLAGRVLNDRGEPVTGAKVEIWQANAHGRYAHSSDPNTAPLDPNFQGFGVQTTDGEGRYRFKTIKPGAYPTGPTRKRPPHIHFDVAGKINRLTTQMFFAGEALNEQDQLFLELGPRKEAAIAHILPTPPDLEADSLVVNFDIVLGRS